MSIGTKIPDSPWSKNSDKLLSELKCDVDHGLSSAESIRRRKVHGKNRLREIKPRSSWSILYEQFKSLIVLLLLIAAALSFAFGDWIEGIAIIIVLLLNAGIGFYTEIRAVRSMESLRRLSTVDAVVRRDGQVISVPAENLVPGDIVIIEGGDIVTADLRLLRASKLQADESALTGESMPVSKTTDVIPAETPLADRRNMLFKGTSVTRGSAVGIAAATGMHTELGKISALVAEAEKEATPLEKRLDKLGHKLIWLTIILTVVIAALGIIRGRDAILMIETAIALAVAAIPEGLPVVATIALARGMLRMARRNALINRLASVETLGATGIICTDKTGTLTENKMTVTTILVDNGKAQLRQVEDADRPRFDLDDEMLEFEEESPLKDALKIGVLCNNASLSTSEDGGVGDPLEVALLEAGVSAGIAQNELLESMPEIDEEAFDSDVKMMGTIHKTESGFVFAVKGAPENVIEVCTSYVSGDGVKELDSDGRELWLKRNAELAEQGLRVLAVAKKTTDTAGAPPYEKLALVGLLGLLDPPRNEVIEAIETCKTAGIRVIMVTGDQPVTAINIARQVGITDSADELVMNGADLKPFADLSNEEKKELLRIPVYARVSPKQKLDLIALHQENGSVVAMTGDGVNDAPALRKADIGIAMGLRGTQVAREAADMVLKDDAFSSIVAAVRQGRIIFGNIRKFVNFLLSCNVSEIIAVGTAAIASMPMPILPLQILFLNLVTDVFPALALGVGEGSSKIMNNPPRQSDEPIVTAKRWVFVGLYGLVMAACVLAAFVIALDVEGLTEKESVSIAFLTLAFAQLFHVFNMRGYKSGLLSNEVTRNGYVWLAVLFCTALLFAAVYIPVIAGVMKLQAPSSTGWLVIAIMSLVPLIVGQVLKLVGVDRQT